MRFVRALIIGSLLLAFAGLAMAETYGNVPKRIVFKGLNTKAGPVSMDDGESPDCLNVHTSLFGTLVKRNGFAKLNSACTHITTSPGVYNGLFDYATDPSTRILVALIDQNLYKMDSLDGTWDPVTTTVSLSDDIAEFANLDGTLLITTWSRDNLRYWTGSGATAHVQIVPKGKYLINAYNRIFMGDCADESATVYPLRFYFSNVGSYSSWLDSAGFYQYATLDAPNGDQFMGWGLLRGRLFGFSRYSVNLITDIGGSDVVQVTKRIDGTGCGAPRSIKVINSPTYGESLIWLTNDKRLMIYNGSTLKDLGIKIQVNNLQSPFALNLMTSNFYKAHAQVYEKEGQYVLWVPISTNINYAIVYDYITDTLWTYSNQNFDSSAVVNTSSGNLIYVGGREGISYRWDYGTSDDGSAINGYWLSRKWDFGWMPLLKKMGEVQVTLKTVGNYNLYYSFRYNWETSFSTPEALVMYSSEWLLGDVLPATLGGKIARTHRLSIDGAFNLLQIKLSDNSTNPAFEVFSLDTISNSIGKVGE